MKSSGIQRNIRLTLEYDGSNFKGWQVQPNQRTVQGELEACLLRLVGVSLRCIAAGRTDAGVHALGQVVNFVTSSALCAEHIQRALNGILPPDIAVREAAEVPLAFHSRRDARRREYLYRIGYRRQAVGRNYIWWMRAPLDTEAMQLAASNLLGHHDFTSFCVAASERENRACHLLACAWHHRNGELHLQIEANRFLRAMVRSIVGTLVQVGRGTRSPDEMLDILAARDRRCAGPTAPAQGLFLKRVTYEIPLVSSGG